MTKLPFLQSRKPATLRKMSGTSKYGFSEDDELIEHSIDELLAAKDPKIIVQALKALIQLILSKEHTDAPNA